MCWREGWTVKGIGARLKGSPWAVAALLGVFAVLALAAARGKSVAYDELFHLTGGYSYWVTNDYRIHPTNGNLVQRWQTLPFLFMMSAMT
jgi:hypothetical protein